MFYMMKDILYTAYEKFCEDSKQNDAIPAFEWFCELVSDNEHVLYIHYVKPIYQKELRKEKFKKLIYEE